MVVVAIVGLIAAVVVPEMKGTFEDAILRSSSRKIVDVCNIAYSRAVSFNREHRVRLDRSTGRYLVEQQVGNSAEEFEPVPESGCSGEIDHRIAIEIQRIAEEPTQESEEAEPEQPEQERLNDAITFHPDGTADGCQVWLMDRTGFKLGLQVSAVTAGVHLVEQEEH
jgi:Tfp pilus assembly protein FimT